MLGYFSGSIIQRIEQFFEKEARGNCELRGADNIQRKISGKLLFKAKLRLLFLLSFKYFSLTRIWGISPDNLRFQSHDVLRLIAREQK